jgi:hypothetical protein
MTASPTPRRAVSTREVAQLLAWLRRLSAAGPAADPAEVAAYQATKADLLARIPDSEYGHPQQAQP